MASSTLQLNGKKRKSVRFHGTDHWLTKEQFTALLAVSDERDALLWRLIAAHGLRISEALAVCPQDVINGQLTINREKGSWQQKHTLLVNLAPYLTNRVPFARIFPFSRQTAFEHFREAAKKAGLHPDLWHPHVLRHTCANWMLSGGASLSEVSQYLGHSSIASTAHYLNCSDKVASDKAAQIIGTL